MCTSSTMTSVVDTVHVAAEAKRAPAKRGGYRHGNLPNALLAAGIDLARTGGPDAVVLREATRRAGVAPNAAYRHYADRSALLSSVCQAALDLLAEVMRSEPVVVSRRADAARTALARLRALGTGYLRFAQDEPGLFRTAFAPAGVAAATAAPAAVGPLALVGSVLDELVAAGVLARRRRYNAEFLVWAPVHGLAMLVLDGPLRGVERAQTDEIGRQLLEIFEDGLAGSLRAAPARRRQSVIQ